MPNKRSLSRTNRGAREHPERPGLFSKLLEPSRTRTRGMESGAPLSVRNRTPEPIYSAVSWTPGDLTAPRSPQTAPTHPRRKPASAPPARRRTGEVSSIGMDELRRGTRSGGVSSVWNRWRERNAGLISSFWRERERERLFSERKWRI